MAAKRSAFRTWLRRVWAIAGLLLTSWMVWNVNAHGVPASIHASDAVVDVASGDGYTTFIPKAASSQRVAVVFLPGGLIDPDAYAPVVRELAQGGVASAIAELPYRSAITEGMRQQLWRRITAAHDRLGGASRLVLAGHSRGAALAAQFAGEHPEVGGLILIATTHPRDHDLSGFSHSVMKILGTRDCVAPIDDARANRAKLPNGTDWREIEGANHAQFGFYGSQINDCTASIDRASQQRQLIAAMREFISALR